MQHFKKKILLFSILTIGFTVFYKYYYFKAFFIPSVTRDTLAQAFEEIQEFPNEIDLFVDGKVHKAAIQYTLDQPLQEFMENLLRSYRPDYAAFVAIDPRSGRVLSIVSYSQEKKNHSENLALKATYPAASVFKIVTAAAAIAEKNFTASTVIPFNGANHTLYRGNVLKSKLTRWTRYMTLKDAFAQSVNTVFAKIGAFSVGPDSLKQYATRLGFNRKIAGDLPIQVGKAIIPEDAWGMAETASGFSQNTTMSPLQGALMAASIVNNGIMMDPYVIDSVRLEDGKTIYHSTLTEGSHPFDLATSKEIRALMRETIRKGTSRRSFRGFFRGRFSEMDVGGKTGSLSGKDPKGKYDWFIGYAEKGSEPIAISVLTIHQKYWKVKSSYLGRRAIERYFLDHAL